MKLENLLLKESENHHTDKYNETLEYLAADLLRGYSSDINLSIAKELIDINIKKGSRTPTYDVIKFWANASGPSELQSSCESALEELERIKISNDGRSVSAFSIVLYSLDILGFPKFDIYVDFEFSIFQTCDSLKSVDQLSFIKQATTIKISDAKNLTSLSGIHKVLKNVRDIDLDNSGVTSSILGLLKIEGFRGIWCTSKAGGPNGKPFEIVNKYLRTDRDLLDCQEELIDEGFEEYAQL